MDKLVRKILVAFVAAVLIMGTATDLMAQKTPEQYKEVEKLLKKTHKKVIFAEKYFLVQEKKGLKDWAAATLDGRVFTPYRTSEWHLSDDFKLVTIAGKDYLIARSCYNTGSALYSLDGKCLIPLVPGGVHIHECGNKIFIEAYDGEIYDEDFNKIVDGKQGHVSTIESEGQCFIMTSTIQGTRKLYSAKGKLLQKDFLEVENGNIDGLTVFIFKHPKDLKLAFRYNSVADSFEPIFSDTLNKTVEFGGKKYYWNSSHFYNADGSLGFDKIIKKIGPDYIICYIDRPDYHYGAYDVNFNPITDMKWDYLDVRTQGKYRWFVATILKPDGGYYYHNNPHEFLTHVVDFNGNEYPFKSTHKDASVKIHNNKLVVWDNTWEKVFDPVPGAMLSNFIATPIKPGELQVAASQPSGGQVARDFPSLEIVEGSLRFVDPTGANAINADGEYAIEFKVRNVGKGHARDCKPTVALSGASAGLIVPQAGAPLNIAPGGVQTVTVPLRTDLRVSDGTAEFAVGVDEPNGFGTAKSILSVATHAFEAPNVLVNDYSVTSTGGTTLQKKIPFDLQLLIQNVSHGRADDVLITLNAPENVYFIEGEASQKFDTMAGGQTRELLYTLVANNNYASETIPIRVELREKHGKYAESRDIELRINQPLTASRLVIDEAPTAPRREIELARLNSDVDLDIPVTGRNAENLFVVVIANENYTQVPSVAYAANDGRVFAEYCRNTLGVPERNIRTVTDATLNEMRRNVSWLAQVGQTYGDKATILLYYSGHGVPDESTGKAYILPVDGYHSDMTTNYALSDLYGTLSGSGAGRAIVLMDACFSGARRGDGTLVAARAVQIKAKAEAPKGNLIVFSAAQGDETAYPYEGQNHGMFTYFLLKKLQESRGEATLGELSDYITDHVTKTSLLENSKLQTPQVQTSPVVAGSWRNSRFK